MLGALLFCSLFYIASAERSYVKVEGHYTGEGCGSRLDPKDYFLGITDLQRAAVNGHPHYLWGRYFDASSVLYCARITSEQKEDDKVYFKFPVAKNLLKGTITGVQVIDNRSPDKGGDVKVAKGGVGSGYAILKFVSGLQKPMDYVVTIFGTPDST